MFCFSYNLKNSSIFIFVKLLKIEEEKAWISTGN